MSNSTKIISHTHPLCLRERKRERGRKRRLKKKEWVGGGRERWRAENSGPVAN